MRAHPRYPVAAVVVVTLAAGAFAAAHGTDPEARAASAGPSKKSKSALRVRGSVDGLYPGGSQQLVVRVSNRSAKTTRIRSIKTRVDDAGPGCSAANLTAERRRVKLRIRPHSSRKLAIAVQMIPDAADACQGAQFPLTFYVRSRR